METKEYLRRANEIFTRIESKLDEYEDDLDFDRTPDKLVISFEAHPKKIVVNTQQAIHEIWLAGNARGWHFKFRPAEEIWFAEAEQEEFYDCFARLLGDHLQQTVTF
jgi:CyaY protein